MGDPRRPQSPCEAPQTRLKLENTECAPGTTNRIKGAVIYPSASWITSGVPAPPSSIVIFHPSAVRSTRLVQEAFPG